jgi:DNA-binding FadR family transcriptional regulator
MARNHNHLAATVVDGILDDIASGRVQPGEGLAPEAALAARFGVSKPVVREALAQLSVQGIVDIRRGRQTVVQPLSSEALAGLFAAMARAYALASLEFIALRRAVETEAATLAAARAGVADVARLREAVELMAANIRTIDPWVEADLLFHRRLAETSGERVLACILSALEPSTRETMRGAKLQRDLAATQRSLACHVELVEAIRARDPTRARAAMAAHFDIVAAQQAAQLALSRPPSA